MTLLVFIWAGLIAFAIFMYVLLDGFDLGIGILFPWVESEQYRNLMINSIAPIWDGNETWLVFGAAALYGAFPLAYSTLLPHLYIPLMIMLIALVFRGVAFEFRVKAEKSQILWDVAFSGGSILATFCQGLVLGTFVQGYILPTAHPYGIYNWFTPFSIMTGLALICGYALLGATWLIIKTENELQEMMFHTARLFLVAVACFLALVSLWTPFVDPDIYDRWFSLPNLFYLSPLPIAAGIVILLNGYAIQQRWEKAPFILSMLTFLLAYAGIGISTWPYIVPRQITFWEAASTVKVLNFFLVGVAILMPILLAYTIYNYWVFRGKVHIEMGYHE